MENQEQKADAGHLMEPKFQQNLPETINDNPIQALPSNLPPIAEAKLLNNFSHQQTTIPTFNQDNPHPATPEQTPIVVNVPKAQAIVPINISNQPQLPIQPLLAPDSPEHNSTDNGQATTVINVPNQQNRLVEQTSPQKTMITKVKLSDELNIFDWLRTTDIINQIAERAKQSVDTVITALDPGMKEYLYSGGNINIMVISDSDNFVSPIRDSFQSAFGRATVFSAKYNPPETANDYPIKLAAGFNESILIAKERIRRLRLDTNGVPQNQVILAVQPSLVNLNAPNNNSNDLTSPNWYLTYCMLLEDPVLNTTLSSYSQFIPIDLEAFNLAKEAKFPDNFPDNQLGFALSIDDIMNSKLRLVPTENQDEPGSDCRWLSEWSGLSETQVIKELSLSLAHLYRRKWNECVN